MSAITNPIVVLAVGDATGSLYVLDGTTVYEYASTSTAVLLVAGQVAGFAGAVQPCGFFVGDHMVLVALTQ